MTNNRRFVFRMNFRLFMTFREEVKNDGRKHIGIESVRSRLKFMVGGTVMVKSAIGEGTRVIIEIPRKE